MILRPFFRLDTMVRTWATAPSARGSSWFCGWRESSLQSPPSTWGSRCPSSGRKHFLSIWSRGLFTQNSTKDVRWERIWEVSFSNPNHFSAGPIQRCAASVCVEQRSEGGAFPAQSVQRAQCHLQTNTSFNWVYFSVFLRVIIVGANKIRKLWKDANNWVIQNAHTAGPSNRRPLPGLCVFRAKPTAKDEIINQMCFIWCRHFFWWHHKLIFIVQKAESMMLLMNLLE